MSNESVQLIYPSEEMVKNAAVSGMDAYRALCAEAEADYPGFWAKRAREFITWKQPFTQSLDESNAPFFKWFADGKLNVSYNCLDRHLTTWRKNKAAIIWEGETGEIKTITYLQLHQEVSRFANVLKKLGVKTGDRVALYMPLLPALSVAMLACARIGAAHTVIFGGFSADAIRDRVNDCGCKLIVTADGGYRRGKVVPLKTSVDTALAGDTQVKTVIVHKRTGQDVGYKARVGAVMLIAFLVPVTVMMHDFWSVSVVSAQALLLWPAALAPAPNSGAKVGPSTSARS